MVDDIRPAHQALEHLARGGLLEIERQTTLPALAAREDTLDAAHLVARGRLELDHVGPEVRHEHGRNWAGQEVAQIQHLQTGQRRAGLRAIARLGWGAALSHALRAEHRAVLSQPRCRSPHARGRNGPKRCSRLPRLAPLGILYLHHVAVQGGLLVVQDLPQPLRGQDGHVGRPQRLEPFPARARLERGLHHRIISPEPGSVSALGARPGDLLLRKLGGHLLHQGHVVGRRHHVNPNPVPTLEEARDHALRQSELECGAGLLGARPVHGERYEGALEQARVHGADATLALAHEETRQNSRGRQIRGAPARQREAQEDRTVAMALLLIHESHARLHEDVVARALGVGVLDGIAQHGTRDERGKALAERGVIQAVPPRVPRPQAV